MNKQNLEPPVELPNSILQKIDNIRDIAEYLNLENIVSELDEIKYRQSQENANLLLPLVGEFSSGKTTLLNALTDCKKLETATKPTTATIYEVHFGCDSCRANFVDKDGRLTEDINITELKNDKLADAKVVTLFDTSKRVPSSTILVDTPGLSSPEPKHKQMLVNFLPQADGIILVSDINQQVTKSLTDFIETIKPSKRPIYLILTKSDTKALNEIDSAKQYISENCKIPIKQIAVVSAENNSLEELFTLLDGIQRDKKEIIKQVDGFRIKNIINFLTKHIEELMNASSSDKELEEAIRNCQYELDKISRNINRLTESIASDIEEIDRRISRDFEDVIFTKLNTLVSGKSHNFDADAISTINNTASLLLNEYKREIRSLLKNTAQKQIGTENEIPLTSISCLDLSSIQMTGLNYNLDLNTMGHEYDGWIKFGVIAAAAVGTVVATGGAAAGIAAATTVDNVIDVADTVTDVGSIISNNKTSGTIEKAVEFIGRSKEKYYNYNDANQQIGQQIGSDKGMIDSIVGFVTEKIKSKPQRITAIHKYIDTYLTPEFKTCIQNISQNLINDIVSNLKNEASELITLKSESLTQLRNEMEERHDLFNKRMNQLREYKTILLTF